ncbi:CP072 protein, partial [Polyodon spathula]|nr:CP072 protein [Polyodon spathula]
MNSVIAAFSLSSANTGSASGDSLSWDTTPSGGGEGESIRTAVPHVLCMQAATQSTSSREHGPEHWFSKWERQCLAEAEQEEPSEEEAEGGPQKLWHLFQNSATAVAQLYKAIRTAVPHVLCMQAATQSTSSREHGPEHWFSKWERQCLAEAEQEEPSEEEAEGGPQKLWHLFQNSATAVAQLYKDRVCQQQGGLSLWVPFQNAATAVTNLYKESVDAHQRSYDLGIQIGYQRRNKDVLAWVKKRRRTIRREDLISFLCGKAPPPRTSRAPPRLTVVSPSTETSSSVETDLQPFREAIALHGKFQPFSLSANASN